MYREVHKLKIFKVFINNNKVYTSVVAYNKINSKKFSCVTREGEKEFPIVNILVSGNSSKIFHTNIKYDGINNINDITKKEEKSIISPLTEYYRELLVSENGQA